MDLLDATNEPGDTTTQSAADFWLVFRGGPNTFCDFATAWETRFALDATKRAAVDAAAAHNGITCV